jgi:pilus assembly protein Flp/PilA
MISLFNRFANDESGATAIEYGLLAALISVAAVTVMQTIGSDILTKFEKVQDGTALGNAVATPPPATGR